VGVFSAVYICRFFFG